MRKKLDIAIKWLEFSHSLWNCIRHFSAISSYFKKKDISIKMERDIFNSLSPDYFGRPYDRTKIYSTADRRHNLLYIQNPQLYRYY